MKLCYQVATPDVEISPAVTAFQGSLEKSFSTLSQLGYDGVELMTLNPGKLDWENVKNTATEYGLKIALVCTGEIFGQLGISFTDPESNVRKEAISRVYEIIDFAGYLGANINIGRVRGQYKENISKKQTEEWALEAFQMISAYAAPKNVQIALETVTIMQTNFINTLEEAKQMVENVNMKNFRLMMDVFHMNIEEPNLLKAICDYSPYNIHVHLADNNRRYPGACGLDFAKIINTFKEVGYDGFFCTEIFQLPDQETAARESIRCLSPIFKNLN